MTETATSEYDNSIEWTCPECYYLNEEEIIDDITPMGLICAHCGYRGSWNKIMMWNEVNDFLGKAEEDLGDKYDVE